MKKIFLLLLAISILPVLVSAGGDHDESGEEEHVIRMTNNGFEPQTITVEEGEEVAFVNDDDVDRWPASNLHPTHGLYPEFDPQKAIEPGDLWFFTFEKAGTWRMHDHLIPSMTGTITVLEGEEKDENAEEGEFLGGLLDALKAFFNRLFSRT